jgi:hypothetical protein
MCVCVSFCLCYIYVHTSSRESNFETPTTEQPHRLPTTYSAPVRPISIAIAIAVAVQRCGCVWRRRMGHTWDMWAHTHTHLHLHLHLCLVPCALLLVLVPRAPCPVLCAYMRQAGLCVGLSTPNLHLSSLVAKLTVTTHAQHFTDRDSVRVTPRRWPAASSSARHDARRVKRVGTAPHSHAWSLNTDTEYSL